MCSRHITQKQFELDPPARISKQGRAILARLQAGEVTNVELARIAIRYSARIHELRKAGYRIELVKQDRESGVCVYRLGDEIRDEIR